MEGGRLDGLDDRELLAAVSDGDRAAFRTLYDRHAPWLLTRLSRRCADPAAVDEVLQDTFLAVFAFSPGMPEWDAERLRWTALLAAAIAALMVASLGQFRARRRSPG